MTVINEKTIFSFLSVKNKKITLIFLFFSEILLKQITQITDEIKNIHGNDYGEQYCNVAINLISKNPSNINEYQILIEAAHSLIDSKNQNVFFGFNFSKR
jgi:hypothetical protein